MRQRKCSARQKHRENSQCRAKVQPGSLDHELSRTMLNFCQKMGFMRPKKDQKRSDSITFNLKISLKTKDPKRDTQHFDIVPGSFDAAMSQRLILSTSSTAAWCWTLTLRWSVNFKKGRVPQRFLSAGISLGRENCTKSTAIGNFGQLQTSCLN
jgi:hypothetical protein